MKERPILFSTPMVRAILEGRKTQTRRVFSPKLMDWLPSFFTWSALTAPGSSFCPYGKPGDRLWVREAFTDAPAPEEFGGSVYIYRADFADYTGEPRTLFKWTPSIFMPRSACRIVLEITDVRAERLQDISREDALSEGVFYDEYMDGYCTDHKGRGFHGSNPCISFCQLWCGIHSPESWDANPWVWAITFKTVQS